METFASFTVGCLEIGTLFVSCVTSSLMIATNYRIDSHLLIIELIFLLYNILRMKVGFNAS